MRSVLMALLLSVVAVFAGPSASPGSAQVSPFCELGQAPEFVFGFKALYDVLGDTMGSPTECEHANPENGDALQQTTSGLSFYRKSTNTPTFTNGFEHWALTSSGLVFWTGESIDPPANATPVAAPRPAGTAVQVVEVLDGETISVRIDRTVETLRLIGLDAPGVVDCFGPDASAWLRAQLTGQTVTLGTDASRGQRDASGRLLAYLWLSDGRNIGQLMIREGYAREDSYGPDYRYRDQFLAAQVEAQFGRRGLWGACVEGAPVAPPA